MCSRWLRLQNITCLAPPRIPVAGKIHAFVFDKTGTITKEGMDFMHIVPVENGEFSSPHSVGEEGSSWLADVPRRLQYTTGACHTVSVLKADGSFVGNAVEVSMVKASGWQLPKESLTDEIKLIPPKEVKDCEYLEIIRQLSFDHLRMTSGVVVRSPDGEI